MLQQLAGSRAGGGGAEVQPPSAQALLTPSLKQAKACGTAEALMEALETHLQDVAVRFCVFVSLAPAVCMVVAAVAVLTPTLSPSLLLCCVVVCGVRW